MKFIIKADSTYEFKYHNGFQYQYSSGTWKVINKRKIVFQSYLRNRLIELNVDEEIEVGVQDNQRKLNIKSNIANDDKKYYKCLIFTDGKLVKVVACDSVNNVILNADFNNILFKITADQRIPSRLLDTLITKNYIIKNKNTNQLNIKLKYQDSLFNYKVFNREEVNLLTRGIRYKNVLISKEKSK
nr:hypothetical protein [Pedobacter sp. ASV2]